MQSEDMADYTALTMVGLRSIIFSNDFEADLNNFVAILETDMQDLYILFNLIKSYANIFDETMKDNALRLVDYYRYDVADQMPGKKNQIWPLCDDIIRAVNQTNDAQIVQFIYDNLSNRYYNIINPTFIPNIDYVKTFEEIKLDYANDFLVLITHLSVVSNEEFEEFIPVFSSVKQSYIANITTITSEFPNLLRNRVFCERIRRVSEILDYNINSLPDEDFTYLSRRRYKKLYKRYVKHIHSLV